jgi:hypothetical protein
VNPYSLSSLGSSVFGPQQPTHACEHKAFHVFKVKHVFRFENRISQMITTLCRLLRSENRNTGVGQGEAPNGRPMHP